ncbi:hypothetical protein DZA50_06890 [Kangiella sp. HD9-110m-PIT-SAG07]|nr:hypothetical protein DZA50_06890 [Kangiella sp. HD9-110m-PIT-SAG07]
MKQHNDQAIRAKLSRSADALEQKHPSSKQDLIFQDNLEKLPSTQGKIEQRKMLKWVVAAGIILSVGLTTVYVGNPLQKEASPEKGLPQLIASSNQLEKQIAIYDELTLNANQYAEYIGLRLELEQIDQQLNYYYSSAEGELNSEVNRLWERRVDVAKSLKSIYQNDTLVARI